MLPLMVHPSNEPCQRSSVWRAVAAAAATARHTELRWHGSFEGWTMSGNIPPEVGELMIQRVVDYGIRYTRTGDNWNRMALLRDKKERLEKIGMTPIIHVMYSVSERH